VCPKLSEFSISNDAVNLATFNLQSDELKAFQLPPGCKGLTNPILHCKGLQLLDFSGSYVSDKALDAIITFSDKLEHLYIQSMQAISKVITSYKPFLMILRFPSNQRAYKLSIAVNRLCYNT
jgi:hypothetical protein